MAAQAEQLMFKDCYRFGVEKDPLSLNPADYIEERRARSYTETSKKDAKRDDKKAAAKKK